MKQNLPSPASNLEERLESWLASQPLTPAPDFVARTLARIHAEASLVSSAQAGNESAIDALIDRWLGEQPLEPEYEPAHLATQTRRTAEEEEQQESRPKETSRRWMVPFPTWARSAVALAAAACVALVTYFSNSNLVTKTTTPSPQLAQNNISSDTTDDSAQPAHYAFAYDPKADLQTSDSLSDGEALLNSDNDNILLGNDAPTEDDSVN
jgi:anti-sigma-K factor RskA